jgi:hypothetical protein
MASAAFERFRFSFFEDPDSPRNGLDMKALAALEGEERSPREFRRTEPATRLKGNPQTSPGAPNHPATLLGTAE